MICSKTRADFFKKIWWAGSWCLLCFQSGSCLQPIEKSICLEPLNFVKFLGLLITKKMFYMVVNVFF